VSSNWKFGSWRDWASLARLPNLPTVWSNIFTAWAIVCAYANNLNLTFHFALALLGGTLFYMAGTTLTDLLDIGFDRQYRPERPIPSGRVSIWAVRAMLLAWLVVGVLALMLASMRWTTVRLDNQPKPMRYIFGQFEAMRWAILALWLCIGAYTWIHKRSAVLSAVTMGLCRVSLGVAVTIAANEKVWDAIPWMAALGINIMGISWLARGESRAVAGGVAGPLILIACAPPLVALLSKSLWSDRLGWELALAAWILAMGWLLQPLRVRRDGPARGMAVGRALAMLPLLDALFLVPICGRQWGLVPLGCLAVIFPLRRVASAT